jgi:hypothetical protein
LNCDRQSIEKAFDCVGRLAGGAGHVGGGRAILDAMAVARERIGAGAADALAVVLFEACEIAVRHRDQLLPRHALRRGDRLEPEILGHIGLVHLGDAGGSAAALAVVDAFDLRDAAELDAQAQTQQQRRAGFAHGAHEGHLAERGVSEVMPVVADSLGGLPETVADLERLVVFGVANVLGEGQALGVVRHHGGEILVDQILQARAVAVEGDGSGGGVRRGENDEQRGKRIGGSHEEILAPNRLQWVSFDHRLFSE